MKSVAIILLSITLTAQTGPDNNRFVQSFSNIYSGFTESVEWYDIPVGAFYISRNTFNKAEFGNYISIPPAAFEISLANSVGRTGNVSAGSIDKDLIPHSIFLGRIGANLLMDLFSDREISSSPYKNAFLFEKSLIYTYTVTEIVKKLVKRERPDNSDTRSFFSGHTSTTFAAATYLYLELNELYYETTWIKRDNLLLKSTQAITFATLFGWAGYVGYSRIKDNKHYISDVLVGASIGSLISYLVYQGYHSGNSLTDNVQLFSYNDTILLSFSMKF